MLIFRRISKFRCAVWFLSGLPNYAICILNLHVSIPLNIFSIINHNALNLKSIKLVKLPQLKEECLYNMVLSRMYLDKLKFMKGESLNYKLEKLLCYVSKMNNED